MILISEKLAINFYKAKAKVLRLERKKSKAYTKLSNCVAL